MKITKRCCLKRLPQLNLRQNRKERVSSCSICRMNLDQATVADIDEAIAHIYKMLKTDEYGNRMDWRKREILSASIDDLLDARLQLSVK